MDRNGEMNIQHQLQDLGVNRSRVLTPQEVAAESATAKLFFLGMVFFAKILWKMLTQLHCCGTEYSQSLCKSSRLDNSLCPITASSRYIHDSQHEFSDYIHDSHHEFGDLQPAIQHHFRLQDVYPHEAKESAIERCDATSFTTKRMLQGLYCRLLSFGCLDDTCCTKLSLK